MHGVRRRHVTAREHGREPRREALPATQKLGHPEPADHERAGGEDHERNRHRRRRLVEVRGCVRIEAALAEEHQEDLPEHVAGGETGAGDADEPEPRPTERARPCLPEDLVLREEAGGERRRPRAPSVAIRKVQEVTGIRVQSPPICRMSCSWQGVDHAAGAEEEAGLEERVRDQMEDAGARTPPRPSPGTCSRAGSPSSTRAPFLMSSCTSPMVAAMSAVAAPIPATTASVAGASA